MVLPAKAVMACLVGLGAPLAALSGLVPQAASPVLLALGVMAALGLSRAPAGGGRPR